MGKEKVSFEAKFQLVTEICNFSKSCAHKSPFVDWYLVLQVEENAGLEMIRRQYRKLGIYQKCDLIYILALFSQFVNAFFLVAFFLGGRGQLYNFILIRISIPRQKLPSSFCQRPIHAFLTMQEENNSTWRDKIANA